MPRARRLVGLCLAAALAAVGLESVAAAETPALAAASAHLTITPPADRALYRGCTDYLYGYDAHPPNGPWSVDLTLRNPAGAMAGQEVLESGTDAAAGTSSLFLCDAADPLGTYTLSAVLTWTDASSTEHTEAPLVTTFTLGRPLSRTTLTVGKHHPKLGKRVTLRVKSREQGQTTYLAYDHARVRLQQLRHGHWRTLRAKRANLHGTTRFHYRPDDRHRARFRVVTVGTDFVVGSRSTPVLVRAHR